MAQHVRCPYGPPLERPTESPLTHTANDSPNDVFIAVMGVTGSGKSSFISRCSGKVVKVGHQLEACTTHVDVYAYEVSPVQTVYLIDTPGFDDTNRSDTEVLKEIARWLVASYKGKILLNGIIYLHRITDIRMQGSARKNLLMFRQLCGENALKRVVLVTTMWDKVPEDEASKREKELIDTPEFWGWMLEKGSSCQRHYNTEDSARIIVSDLASHAVPVTTALQAQMVDEKKKLGETSAGQELQSEMNKEKAKWAQERREIEDQLRLAIEQRDHEAEEMMREERDRYTKMIQKVENDTETLKATMNKLLAERDERVAEMETMLKLQQVEYNKQLAGIRDRQSQLEKENAELLARQQPKRSSKGRLLLQEDQSIMSRGRNNSGVHYSLAIRHGDFVCIGPHYTSSSAKQPEETKDGCPIKLVSFGDTYDPLVWSWIAHYPGSGWSEQLGLAYQGLWNDIHGRGLKDLELCALGPDKTYYAKWKTGHWTANVSEEIKKVLVRAHKHGGVIKAIALGYGGSYVITWGKAEYTSEMLFETSMDLKGYYGNFNHQRWFRGAGITAVALDISNPTDYILVYINSSKKASLARYISNNKSQEEINEWWLRDQLHALENKLEKM
ncbi:hypothetical protein BJX66DRAFT_335022 [Aspergillus keveii]|uniref:G domain-containing protein n=1 Tax=Aspergillus keveii TaxID=714993 RepID=A0ABR4GED2_9EURO